MSTICGSVLSFTRTRHVTYSEITSSRISRDDHAFQKQQCVQQGSISTPRLGKAVCNMETFTPGTLESSLLQLLAMP